MRAQILGMTMLAVFLTAASGSAQETAIAGTITDGTDAVLPGVTVTATHAEAGTASVGVTDGLGQYTILALRPGLYNVKAELTGFTTVVQERVELLVGQRVVRNFKLAVSAVSESITVTGETPLVDTSQSKISGNVTARQMEALPLNGRNWMQLTTLAPGSRANAVTDTPFASWPGAFQVNMDGHQVTGTQTLGGFGPQPKYSRDAIAEFELVTSRVDATQGRSYGMVVNAVTKAGTNALRGTTYAYFRDDKFNAKDFIVNRVLPYSDQQAGVTIGGPIRKNRVHFFGYYEGEREPLTLTFTSPYPRFNIPDLQFTRIQNLSGGRVDMQINDRTRLMGRASSWISDTPIETTRNIPGATGHPTTAQGTRQVTWQAFATLTQTFNQKTNEIRVGYAVNHGDYKSISSPGGLANKTNVIPPAIILRGYAIGAGGWFGREYQDTFSLRDDFTMIRGRHELKTGGDFILPSNFIVYDVYASNRILADRGPVPANIQDLFPVWNDPTTWNLAALSPITGSVVTFLGNNNIHCVSSDNCWRTKPQFGAWFQDNWRASERLTLNLGIRWDFVLDPFGNELDFSPFYGPRDNEFDNFQPRVGGAFQLTERSVIRGGFGKYVSGSVDSWTHTTEPGLIAGILEVFNDGRANFAADPFNLLGGGRLPPYSGGIVKDSYSPSATASSLNYGPIPYAYQSSLGLQHQLTETIGVQADYVSQLGRHEDNSQPGGGNVSFNPATGRNFPFSDVSRRPFPQLGQVSLRTMSGRSHYQALQTAVQKRLSNRWQATLTYTLGFAKNNMPAAPILPGCKYPFNGVTRTCDQPLTLARDMGGEWGYGALVGQEDQRHRAVLNGIYSLPYGIQLSGLYFYGSGLRYATTYGADLGDSARLSFRLRPDGSIVPRNNFVGLPIHRVDMRLQKRFTFLGSRSLDGMLEVFNLFNHKNYGSYVTAEVSPSYGRPVQNFNIAYQPRVMQLGLKLTF
jgi:hypothetical protein